MTHLGLTLWMSLAVGQMAPDVTDKLEAAFAKSISYEKQLQYADAIKVLTDLPLSDRQGYYAQVRLGFLYYSSAKYAEGKAAYEAAIQQAPESTEAKLGLTLVLLAQLKFSEAEGMARQVIQQDPFNYFANLRLAFALRNQYKFDQADAVNNTMLDRYPSDVSFLLEAGLCKVGKKDQDAANKIFQRVVLLAPDNAIANQQLKRDPSKKKAG